MNVVHIISKKRDGGELTADEIGFIVNGYVRGTVADYQMSSWAMAEPATRPATNRIPNNFFM